MFALTRTNKKHVSRLSFVEKARRTHPHERILPSARSVNRDGTHRRRNTHADEYTHSSLGEQKKKIGTHNLLGLKGPFERV